MTEAIITDRWEFETDGSLGKVRWTVTEFDSGHRMLGAAGAGIQFSAHFTEEQWIDFRRMIAVT
jgi:hypothetical protein